MKATFKNLNLINFKGQVLVDNDGFPKRYSSLNVANKTAEKLNAKVVKNFKGFLVVL